MQHSFFEALRQANFGSIFLEIMMKCYKKFQSVTIAYSSLM